VQGSVWYLYCSLSICLNLFRFRVRFSSIMTIKHNIILDWFPKMTWECLFQPLFPESQTLCAENKHKKLSEWLADLKFFVIFRQKRNFLNMAVHSFFQTLRPLIHWYAGSYEFVFKISTISMNHFLKVAYSCLYVRAF